MPTQPLVRCYDESAPDYVYEIGVDEAGRGPLFGRVYAAAVIWPRGVSADKPQVRIRDSKKYSSHRRLEEAAEYVKQHAIAWHVAYESEQTIDAINILQATQRAMHAAIREVMRKAGNPQCLILVDGNYFNPLVRPPSAADDTFIAVPFVTIEGGDNKYESIAAASILAKTARDQYIADMCAEHPELVAKYGLDSNKGYGTKRHMDGIKEHGITQWHRRSFGPCK